MTLRKRTLLTIGAIGLFLMVVLYTLSSTILLHSFTQLEKEDAQQGVERALAVWENALNELRLAARDWAFWDATYEFVQNGNAGYVNSNLVPQTFNNLRINLLLLVNPSGKIVFGAGFDLQNQMAAPIPPGITDYVSPGGLLQRTSAKNDMSGIIVLPDHVLLVTSWPILPTSETGESRGVLIMGRYLDEIEVERLARLTGVSVKILRFDEAVSPIDRMAIQLEALRQGGLELASQLELDSLLRAIVVRAIHLMEADDGGLYLYRPEQDALERAVSVGGTIPVGSLLRRGEGLSGRVWETGEPLIVDDYQRWAGKASVFQTEPTMAVIGVPVRWGDKFLGILNVAASPPHTFTAADAELLSLFATQAAVALENARLFSAARQRTAELETLRQASLRLTAQLELQPVLEAILESTLRLVAADDAHIFLYDGQAATFGAALWADGRREQPHSMPRPDGLTYAVARTGERIVIPNVNEHPLFHDWRWGGAIVGLPLCIGQRVLGVMNVAWNRPHNFDEGELRVLGLAVSLGIIQEHGGRIDVESFPGQGSTFTVWLPLGEGTPDLEDSR